MRLGYSTAPLRHPRRASEAGGKVVVTFGSGVTGPSGVSGIGQATRRMLSNWMVSRNDMMFAVVLSWMRTETARGMISERDD